MTEKIYAMAFSRQKALERLDSLSLPISEHLFKYVALPDHQSIFHWEKELKSWRKALSRYNVSNTKTPNYNKATLKKYIYEEPLGDTEDIRVLHKIIEEDYNIKIDMPANFPSRLKKVMDAFIESILKNEDIWLQSV